MDYEKIYNLVKLNLKSPRIVGKALHNNPDSKSIQCHRVVNSRGMVAESFAFGGASAQKGLLEKERKSKV